MKKIKKCVIPAAGMGTRFLPATKALPKEMFPVVDKPVMQYLVEEAIAAGCEDIIIVTGRSKRAIEDHFDSNPELEQRLDDSGKFDYLKKVKSVGKQANIVYVRQPYPRGDGDAILRTKNLIGDEPFLVLFGDDIIDNDITAAEQLIAKHEQTGSPVIATVGVSEDEVSSYGMLEGQVEGTSTKVSKFLEKPKAHETDSRTAVIGKYVLTSDIFEYLENAKSNSGDGEIRLADAFIDMLEDRDIYGLEVEGTRYDTGSKIGYLKACIAYAMKDEDVVEELQEFTQRIHTKKGRVCLFIDQANLWSSQKKMGYMIDYEKLCSFIEKECNSTLGFKGLYFAYPKSDTRSYNVDGIHRLGVFLEKRLGFHIVKKPIKQILIKHSLEEESSIIEKKEYKEKGNLDIELAIDMHEQGQQHDICVLFSGDSDYLCVLEALKKQGKKIYILSTEGNISHELKKISDKYYDIAKISELRRGEMTSREK